MSQTLDILERAADGALPTAEEITALTSEGVTLAVELASASAGQSWPPATGKRGHRWTH